MSTLLQVLLTHAIALLVGAGAGWWAKGKYGAKVQADAETLAKKV